MLVKQCSKCGVVKSTSLFTKKTRNKSGLDSWCKECKANYVKENKEDIKITQKYWYLNKTK